MFADVRAELALRIVRIGAFLNQINEGDGSPGSGASGAPDFKGLFFVYLYGAYEHCIVDGFREALIAANAHGLTGVEVRPELAGLAFNSSFDSLESAPGAPSRWLKRATVTKLMFSTDAVNFPDFDRGLRDGNHFRPTHIETIWALFGITQPTLPDPRYTNRIIELIERRHDVAHGRLPPDAVGRKFTVADLRQRAQEVELCCLYFVGTLEAHVVNRANLIR